MDRDAAAAASALALKNAADQSERDKQNAAAQADREKHDLRMKLVDQLNRILETRDSARGLIVNMSDVLFDTGKFTLKPDAREKLAKISGIVLAYPSLKLAVEGYTDSVGSSIELNMKLSDNRAGAVRDFLVNQGIGGDSITAHGFGEDQPVASNDTAAGRQQNRRVEMVVSGDVIGGLAGNQTAAVIKFQQGAGLWPGAYTDLVGSHRSTASINRCSEDTPRMITIRPSTPWARILNDAVMTTAYRSSSPLDRERSQKVFDRIQVQPGYGKRYAHLEKIAEHAEACA